MKKAEKVVASEVTKIQSELPLYMVNLLETLMAKGFKKITYADNKTVVYWLYLFTPEEIGECTFELSLAQLQRNIKEMKEELETFLINALESETAEIIFAEPETGVDCAYFMLEVSCRLKSVKVDLNKKKDKDKEKK